jgi:hypothetical protein
MFILQYLVPLRSSEICAGSVQHVHPAHLQPGRHAAGEGETAVLLHNGGFRNGSTASQNRFSTLQAFPS